MTGKRNILHQIGILFFLLLFSSITFAQNIKVKVEAPGEVWVGDKFRVMYIIESDENGDGTFKMNDFKGLEVISGPTESTNSSVSIIEGKREAKYTRNISYIVEGNKAGKYTLPKGEYTYNGKNYKTETASVTIKTFEQAKNDKEAFIRTVVSRTNVSPGDTLVLTYRLYTTMNFRQILKNNYPSVAKDFYANNWSRGKLVVQEEEYEGKTYKVIDIRRLILQPRNIGMKEIPSGSVTIEFGIPTGKKVRDFFGDTYEEILKEVQTVPIEAVKISVRQLIEI